jgi:hypothetical protein
MMIRNIPIEPTIRNISADQKIPIVSDFESNKRLVEQLEELSRVMIAEYNRTIVFTGTQVANTFRLIEYFYPSTNTQIHKRINTMVTEVITILDYFNTLLMNNFNSKYPGDNKKQAVQETTNDYVFHVYKAILVEKMHINEFGNSIRFTIARSYILELGKVTRSKIGNIVLKFQEENFINPKIKEIYHD